MKFTITSKKTGRPFRAYLLDGIQTIGVEVGEPFSLDLENSLCERIGVRFSVDGTDVQTAKPASPEPSGGMFIVESRGRTSISAWVESNRGGAALIFAPEGFGVAQNTHGDTSQRGYLACAIFRDTYRPPMSSFRRDLGSFSGGLHGGLGSATFGAQHAMEQGISVGAGDYTRQELQTVSGLRQPALSEILTVRYMSAEYVRERLPRHPSGFGPVASQGANLSGVPRFSSTQTVGASDLYE